MLSFMNSPFGPWEAKTFKMEFFTLLGLLFFGIVAYHFVKSFFSEPKVIEKTVYMETTKPTLPKPSATPVVEVSESLKRSILEDPQTTIAETVPTKITSEDEIVFYLLEMIRVEVSSDYAYCVRYREFLQYLLKENREMVEHVKLVSSVITHEKVYTPIWGSFEEKYGEIKMTDDKVHLFSVNVFLSCVGYLEKGKSFTAGDKNRAIMEKLFRLELAYTEPGVGTTQHFTTYRRFLTEIMEYNYTMDIVIREAKKSSALHAHEVNDYMTSIFRDRFGNVVFPEKLNLKHIPDYEDDFKRMFSPRQIISCIDYLTNTNN